MGLIEERTPVTAPAARGILDFGWKVADWIPNVNDAKAGYELYHDPNWTNALLFGAGVLVRYSVGSVDMDASRRRMKRVSACVDPALPCTFGCRTMIRLTGATWASRSM